MRAFVPSEKAHREIGEVRWEVTWHTLRDGWTPEFEGDGPDPDSDIVYHGKACGSESYALHVAESLVKQDYFGSPIVQRQVVEWWVQEDGIAEWEDVGEPIYVG